MLRIGHCVALVLVAVGCASLPIKPPAPATFGVHADAAGAYAFPQPRPGFIGAADAGFEMTHCCGLGMYMSFANFAVNGEDMDHERWARPATRILDGGVELGVITPWPDHRLRLRLRAGKAGTPPNRVTLGRSGYSAHAAALFRLWNPATPEVGQEAANVDLFAGYSGWGLGAERTSGGAMGDSQPVNAVLVGVRLGVDYGVDFE